MSKRYFALISSVLVVFGLIGFAASSASAATVCAPLTTHDNSFVSPIHSGEALNAINWGGGGSLAKACTGALVNDEVKVWHNGGAPSDFTEVLVTAGTTGLGVPTACTSTAPCVQLVYTPGNQVSTTNPLCVSTVLNQLGAAARLRPCAGLTVNVSGGFATIVNAAPTSAGTVTNGNQWQDFNFDQQGDGFWEIEAVAEGSPGPFSLNISGSGGNGTQVISWHPLVNDNCVFMAGCADNEIWEPTAAQ